MTETDLDDDLMDLNFCKARIWIAKIPMMTPTMIVMIEVLQLLPLKFEHFGALSYIIGQHCKLPLVFADRISKAKVSLVQVCSASSER